MKVNISVHGRWHAFELANGLHARGAMGRLATTYPKLVARRFLAPGIEIRAHPSLEVRRRLYDRWRVGPKPDLAIARAFGRFAATVAVDDADMLVGWSAGILEAIAPARAARMKVVVERGSTHIRNQVRILTEAYEEFGLRYDGTDPEIVARELAEYEGADAIAVPTDYAASTFIAEGVPRDKLIVNPYGVDLARFAPAVTRPPNRPIRVLCVGRVGIQKGIPWLIRAFGKVGFGAELHLVGPIDDEAASFLGERGSNVFLRGPLRGSDLPAEYAAADIFCLPSLQEGMPLTLLQAMASGLPAVVTPPAGSGLVSTGEQGIMVPVRNVDGLAHALERLIGSAEVRRHLGENARRVVATGHGWDEYAARALAAYRGLLA
jgi:glycosyltransferase involved in cell wall biosynthesis